MIPGAPTPDPELDALIAEHVMGWVRNRHGRLWPDRQCFGYRNSRGHGFIQPYSTDPSAAMEVIETLTQKPHNTRLECLSNRDGEFSCTLVKPGRRKSEKLLYIAHAPWPALAICLAAMKTFEPILQAQAGAGAIAAREPAKKLAGRASKKTSKKISKQAAKKKRSAS